MSLIPVPAGSLIGRLAEFDTLIDARSEDEYREDHLPGAVNFRPSKMKSVFSSA